MNEETVREAIAKADRQYAHVYIDDANAGEAFTKKYIIPYHTVGAYQEQIL